MRTLVLLLLFVRSAHASQLHLQPVENVPPRKNLDAEIARDRDEVAVAPHDRAARLRLVGDLRRAGRLDEALSEAQAWRAVDAYNLVVVRLVGDLNAELGRTDTARRVYSAVVELIPNDAQAQRALATVLKQNGALDDAYARLRAAASLLPDDRRIAFELADTAHRLGKTEEAKARFLRIAETNDQLGYPARQRLQQLLGAELRRADGAHRAALRQQIEALRVSGGLENDLKVYLTWDTDHSDVDLWVTPPRGEKIFYRNKHGRDGEALYDDVTTGYGPESFTARKAQPGTYTIEVNYYSGGRGDFTEARGEVLVILHEGQPDEERHVLPYRLLERGQTVTVARVEVGGAR